MGKIIETITSSNILFFSIIGVLLLVILIMILLIRKENKNKLNNILDQSKAIKVLEEKEITDTIAIPNVENNQDDTVSVSSSLDSGIPMADPMVEIENQLGPINTTKEETYQDLPFLANGLNSNFVDEVPLVNEEVTVEPLISASFNEEPTSIELPRISEEQNSGATLSETSVLPTIEEDEVIEPIINPFDLIENNEDLNAFNQINEFQENAPIQPLPEDDELKTIVYNEPLINLEEEVIEPLPVVEEPVIEPTTTFEPIPELPKEEIIPFELPSLKEEPEFVLPELKEEEQIELPSIEEDNELVPLIDEEDDLIKPEITIEEPEEKEEIVIEQPIIEEVPPVSEETTEEEPVVAPTPIIPISEPTPSIFDEDDEDGKYEYDEDEDDEVEGVTLSELSGEEITDDNLLELKDKLEERIPNNVIHLTKYEEEQEERAIISYDELISKTDSASIEYHEQEQENSEIDIRQIDLERTGQIELDPIKKELNTKVDEMNYEHEEEFLDILKTLRDELK